MSAPKDIGHLGELNFQQLAEERPDVDAGKKIARAPGSSGGAGVVAELGMTESEQHIVGNRYRPGSFNFAADQQRQRHHGAANRSRLNAKTTKPTPINTSGADNS